jgi:signal transduction histidine kinase
MKILVIDDSPVDYRLVERALGDSFTPSHLETLAEGLKAAATGHYDLLILDLFLPDSKGYETFERAHAALPNLPILVLSGLDDDTVALKTLSGGAQDFVRKAQLLEYPLNRAAQYAVERFRAAQAIRQSERFSRAILDALSAHVAITDNSGRIIAANLAWQKFGVENGLDCNASAIGANYLQICDHAAGRDADFARDTAKGIREVLSGRINEFYLEYPCHSSQSQRWFALRVTRFGEGDDMRLVLAHENITERKRYAAVEQERLALHSAIGAMDQVLGVVGHELRTPLAGLQAISEFLLDTRSRNTPDFEKFLVSLHTETTLMSDTVDNLLEVARLNSGRARWNWGKVVLKDVCSEAIEGIRPQVNGEVLSLRYNVQPLSAVMLGDGGAVRRLMINLLANAKKNTTTGVIDLSARVDTGEDGHLWVELAVRDTGNGIEPAILERLGQAFALNCGVIGDSSVRGSGLGLAICKGIAAAHGGLIRVDSELGKGTIVTARLRADLAAAAETEPADLKIISCRPCIERAA